MAGPIPTTDQEGVRELLRLSYYGLWDARSTYRECVALIVIVEDDSRLRELIARVLAGKGHGVTAAATAMDGLDSVVSEVPDLVILDLGLPDLDGFELLKMIRAVSDVPVIVATARGEDDEVVRTLHAGADDYLVKPFSTAQIEARVQAVLRRASSGNLRTPVEVGELTIDPAARSADMGGRELELSPKEFDLLHYLAERPGTVVSKRELLAEVWREPYGGGEKTIDVHLSWLRKKLGESAAEPRYLRTVFGVGVKLVDPDA